MRTLLLAVTVTLVGCSGTPPSNNDGGGGGAGGGGSVGGGGGSMQDAGACNPACDIGRTCCAGKCVNTENDPTNCGGCGVRCSDPTPYCGGTCMPTPCNRDGGVCPGGGLCCGSACCAAGQLCCDSQGPVGGITVCHTPTMAEPTCPQGCAPVCASDRNIKRDIAPADERAVLQTVANLPVSTWRYQDEPPDVRHLGPMAQDFRAAFGLGDSDRAYHSIDAHGVSLASIKALYRMLQEQEARLSRLEAENAALRASCEKPRK